MNFFNCLSAKLPAHSTILVVLQSHSPLNVPETDYALNIKHNSSFTSLIRYVAGSSLASSAAASSTYGALFDSIAAPRLPISNPFNPGAPPYPMFMPTSSGVPTGGFNGSIITMWRTVTACAHAHGLYFYHPTHAILYPTYQLKGSMVIDCSLLDRYSNIPAWHQTTCTKCLTLRMLQLVVLGHSII